MRRSARETSPEVSTSRAVVPLGVEGWCVGPSWLGSSHHLTSFPASQDGG